MLDDHTTCMNQMRLFNSELSEVFYHDPVSKWFTEEITMYLQQAIGNAARIKKDNGA